MTDAAADRRLGRSALALLAGFVAVFVLSVGTDVVLHAAGVYPPWTEPMYDPGLNALAVAYRCVFTVFGGWLCARLAPHGPLGHALLLGAIGTVLAAAGAFAAIGKDLGPMWMPIALVVTALPTTWYGAHLYATRKS